MIAAGRGAHVQYPKLQNAKATETDAGGGGRFIFPTLL